MNEREILTIGYEGSDIEDFVAVLVSLKVEALCDVRDVVSSRKRGFSKTPLSEALATAGIKYHHFKALGDPKDGRMAARAGNVAEFRKIYGDHLRLGSAQHDLSKLNQVVLASRACLMCFEREPKECHRSIVADALRLEHGYTIRHVGVPKGFLVRGTVGRSAEEKSGDDHRQSSAEGGQNSR